MEREYGTLLDIENALWLCSEPIRWDFLHSFLEDRDKAIKILDVGCGTGSKMLSLLNEGYYNITGVELDRRLYRDMIETYPGLRIVQGNAEQLTAFEQNHLDVVYCYHVLEHLLNPELAIKEAHRVLKTSGAYIIGVPNGYHLNDMILNILKRIYYGKTDHLHRFSLKRIRTLLDRNGFDVIRVDSHKDSLEFLKDQRFFPGFVQRVVYPSIRVLYWHTIRYDIIATKR